MKARLLDQRSIAGVGNLLADETLWRARFSPRRSAGSLSVDELDHLRRVLRAATRDAIRKGGVHTGKFIPFRKRGAALSALRDDGRAGDDRRAGRRSGARAASRRRRRGVSHSAAVRTASVASSYVSPIPVRRSVAVDRICPTSTDTDRFEVFSSTRVAPAAARRAGSRTAS